MTKQQKEEVKEDNFKCPTCGTLVNCIEVSWCPKCKKFIDFENCEIISTPSDTFIEEKMKELLESQSVE